MSNRRNRRAEAARARKATPSNADMIDMAMRQLASAGPTATGGTLFLPDGTVRFISADEARAWASDQPEGMTQ
jgi:hypothetical protein